MSAGAWGVYLWPRQRYDLFRVTQNDGYCGSIDCCQLWLEDTTEPCPRAVDLHYNRSTYLVFGGPRGEAFHEWGDERSKVVGDHVIPAEFFRNLEHPHWLLDRYDPEARGKHIIPAECFSPLSVPEDPDAAMLDAIFEPIPAPREQYRVAPQTGRRDARGPSSRR